MRRCWLLETHGRALSNMQYFIKIFKDILTKALLNSKVTFGKSEEIQLHSRGRVLTSGRPALGSSTDGQGIALIKSWKRTSFLTACTESEDHRVTNQISITSTSPLCGGRCLCRRIAFINKKRILFSFFFGSWILSDCLSNSIRALYKTWKNLLDHSVS